MIGRTQLSVRLALSYLVLSSCTAVASTLPAGPERNWDELEHVLANRRLPPSWRDADGNSIVYYHLRYGSELDAIAYLRKAKSAGIVLPDSVSLFNYAIDNGMQQVVRAMLALGANPNGTQSITPLMRAAAKEHLEIMRMLLRAGASAGKSNSNQDEAISYALINGKYKAIKLLESNGINIRNYLRHSKRDLIFDSIDGGSWDVVSLLVKAGANLRESRRAGETVLTYAVTRHASDLVVELLLQNGADPCVQNDAGYSAKQLVMKLNSQTDGLDRRYQVVAASECH